MKTRSTPAVSPRIKAAKPAAPVYQLEVKLEWTEPLVWRRLQVPGGANLGWLHAVLQLAMGWTNSHIHQYQIGDEFCSDPAFGLDQDDPSVKNEHKVILSQAAPSVGDTLDYEYDLGDSWHHQIIVEKILPADTDTASQYALCLDGARLPSRGLRQRSRLRRSA